MENLKDAVAYNPTLYIVVPLISPLHDIHNQNSLARSLKVVHHYYRDRSYTFPFADTEGNNFDYLDFKYLSGKGIVLVAEWDQPVKIVK